MRDAAHARRRERIRAALRHPCHRRHGGGARQLIVGTPGTFAVEVARQVKTIGVNYMNFSFFFGTMAFADAMRSVKLFAAEVMPKFATL